MNQDCLFCKIIAGEIPATKVYEDEHTLAFLDIHPTNIGHTLVVPKEHHENIYTIPDELDGPIFSTVKKIAIAVKAAVNADGVNIIMNNDRAAGQLIFHAHIHVVPRFPGDGFEHWQGARDYAEGEAQTVATAISSKLH